MSNSKSIQSLFLEVGSIVLGVLLALGVSEWQEDRVKKELAQTALSNVHGEIAINIKIINAIHEINTATIAAVQSNAADTDEENENQFIPGLQVRDTSWNTLLSSGVSNHIDYDLLLVLSDTYSIQSMYKQVGLQLIDASMNMSAMATVNNTDIDNQHFQRQFSAYFTMILQMEESLIQKYGATQKALELAIDDKMKISKL